MPHTRNKHTSGTGRQRLIGCLICMDHFPQKSPIISGEFAESDARDKASHGSLPLCRVDGVDLSMSPLTLKDLKGLSLQRERL